MAGKVVPTYCSKASAMTDEYWYYADGNVTCMPTKSGTISKGAKWFDESMVAHYRFISSERTAMNPSTRDEVCQRCQQGKHIGANLSSMNIPRTKCLGKKRLTPHDTTEDDFDKFVNIDIVDRFATWNLSLLLLRWWWRNENRYWRQRRWWFLYLRSTTSTEGAGLCWYYDSSCIGRQTGQGW